MEPISVIIADDDRLVLQDLKQLVDWKQLGFCIAATAKNGEQALKYVKKYQPGLLITDIIMPGMSGLELILKVREASPDIQIMIISSYDEFDYAKKAIKLGVSDYILKNEITAASFTEKLIALAASIRESSKINGAVLSQELNAYFAGTAESELNSTGFDAVSAAAPDTAFDAASGNLKYLEKERYYFFILGQSTPFLLDVTRSNELFTSSVNYLISLTRQIDSFPISLVFTNEKFVLLGIRIESSSTERSFLLSSISRRIFTLINGRSPRPCMLVYTGCRQTIREFRKLYTQVLPILRFYSMFCPGQPVPIEELKQKHCIQAGRQFPFQHLDSSPDNLEKNIMEIKTFLVSCNDALDLPSIMNFYIGFCRHMETLRECSLDFPDPNYFISFEDMLKWIFNTYEKCLVALRDGKSARYSLPVKNSIDYMEKNYSDYTLNAEMISEHAALSSGRLGVLFKQETQQTINEYLTHLRISHAIWLLANTNLKIYEISEKCGYRSSQYFSQVFYQHTGRRPIDYRKLPSK